MIRGLKKLNLGCGKDIKIGYVNCDIELLPGVDVKVDLEQLLPFDKNVACEILAFKVLEHLHNPVGFLDECWRISAKGGLVKLTAPHTSNLALHGCLVHFRGVNLYSFNIFDPLCKNNYMSKGRFKVKEFKYVLPNIVGKSFSAKILRNLYIPIKPLIEKELVKHPRFVEYYLANLFNLGEFHVTLEVLK